MQSRSSATFVLFIVVLFVLPVPYVLSLGPCVWLASRGMISPEYAPYVSMFYYPVDVAEQLAPGLGTFLDWYCALWK